MSPTTSARAEPRATAPVSITISSIVDRQGRLVAQHDHRRGVADEQEFDPRGSASRRRRRVVRRHHRDLLAAPLHLGERGSDSLLRASCVSVLPGARCRSGGRRRRARAAASTGGSNGATSRTRRRGRRASRACLHGILRRQRAWQRECLSRGPRATGARCATTVASPSGSRTVGWTLNRSAR